jgi:hypothetical protein
LFFFIGDDSLEAMDIEFQMTSLCIQTEARKRYERLMSEYFKQAGPGGDLSDLEERIEALLYFLEHADFGYLRSTYPFLNGNRESANVVLHIPDNLKKMKLICDKEVIDIASI